MFCRNQGEICGVAEQLPIKQGLKRNDSELRIKFDLVAEQLPIKQGLKLHQIIIIKIITRGRRATSNKTRIETIESTAYSVEIACRRATSNKTRIETFIDIIPQLLF